MTSPVTTPVDGETTAHDAFVLAQIANLERLKAQRPDVSPSSFDRAARAYKAYCASAQMFLPEEPASGAELRDEWRRIQEATL